MDSLIDWVGDNMEWLFSGIGVLVLSAVGGLVFKKRHTSSKQVIRSGDRSTNIQVGRDVNIETKNGNDAEAE